MIESIRRSSHFYFLFWSLKFDISFICSTSVEWPQLTWHTTALEDLSLLTHGFNYHLCYWANRASGAGRFLSSSGSLNMFLQTGLWLVRVVIMVKMPQTVTVSAVLETRAICKVLPNVSVGLYGCNLDRLFIAHFQNILYHSVAEHV